MASVWCIFTAKVRFRTCGGGCYIWRSSAHEVYAKQYRGRIAHIRIQSIGGHVTERRVNQQITSDRRTDIASLVATYCLCALTSRKRRKQSENVLRMKNPERISLEKRWMVSRSRWRHLSWLRTTSEVRKGPYLTFCVFCGVIVRTSCHTAFPPTPRPSLS